MKVSGVLFNTHTHTHSHTQITIHIFDSSLEKIFDRKGKKFEISLISSSFVGPNSRNASGQH